MKKTNTKKPNPPKRPRQEEPVEVVSKEEEGEDDPEVRDLLEAQEREERAREEREASDKMQKGMQAALKSFESGRAAAKNDTLNFPVVVLGCRERDQASRSTLATVLVPSCVSRKGGIPTHSSSSGKERYTKVRPDGSLAFQTFVSEKSQKDGASPVDVVLYPRTAALMGIPDIPGSFPLGEPLQLFDISGMSYIKKTKKEEPSAQTGATDAAEAVKYGPGAPITPGEKPVQGNSISSPSGLQNILMIGKKPLQKLSFKEALVMWAPLAQTKVEVTPTTLPSEGSNNLFLIPTGPEIYSLVKDLTGISVLPTRMHEYGPDEGKGVHFDTCALPLAMDPTRTLKQMAFGRLYQVQNQEAHLASVAANEKDPSKKIVPMGASVSVAGYGEFLNWFGIDSFSRNTMRWTQTLLNCMQRANGFLVCRIDWEKSVKRAQNLNESSLVESFNPTVFTDEAPTAQTGAGSKLIQPLVTNAIAVVQDWRTLIMELGIRVQPVTAKDFYERANTENRDMVSSKHQPVSTDRLIAMFLGQGVVPLYVHTGKNEAILKCLPVQSVRQVKVKGKDQNTVVTQDIVVWKAPENPKYDIEYRFLSPTVLKMPNPKEVVAEVNAAKPIDSGARFLHAMIQGSSITGFEESYKSNPVVGKAIRTLRMQSILPIDTSDNLVVFAVLVDKPDSPAPVFNPKSSIRPEVLAIVNNITGPLKFGPELKEVLKTHPDRKLLNSHGSDLLSLLEDPEPAAPKAKRAKVVKEPEPESMDQEPDAGPEDGQIEENEVADEGEDAGEVEEEDGGAEEDEGAAGEEEEEEDEPGEEQNEEGEEEQGEEEQDEEGDEEEEEN